MKEILRKKQTLQIRSEICKAIREFFTANDYIEVETPYLVPAPMPEAHIEAFKTDGYYLHTSPELCMKRLLCSGYERIFQICRVFRKDEKGRYHLPEFTMLEWYRTRSDYNDLMNECEQLITWLSNRLNKGVKLKFKHSLIDLKTPWDRVSLNELFQNHASIPLSEALKKEKYEITMIDEIEPILPVTRPVFIVDYPSELSPLAKPKEDNQELAERFELYIGGIELANGFSELNDPEEQRKRLERENHKRSAQGKKPYLMPEAFLNELSFMPPSAGVAMGIDRLAMLFSDSSSIEDVVSFSHTFI